MTPEKRGLPTARGVIIHGPDEGGTRYRIARQAYLPPCRIPLTGSPEVFEEQPGKKSSAAEHPSFPGKASMRRTWENKYD